jgi:hypothetical protein
MRTRFRSRRKIDSLSSKRKSAVVPLIDVEVNCRGVSLCITMHIFPHHRVVTPPLHGNEKLVRSRVSMKDATSLLRSWKRNRTERGKDRRPKVYHCKSQPMPVRRTRAVEDSLPCMQTFARMENTMLSKQITPKQHLCP